GAAAAATTAAGPEGPAPEGPGPEGPAPEGPAPEGCPWRTRYWSPRHRRERRCVSPALGWRRSGCVRLPAARGGSSAGPGRIFRGPRKDLPRALGGWET